MTRLITLVSAIAQKMGIEEALDPELSELGQDVAPERVLDAMEHLEQSEATQQQKERRGRRLGQERDNGTR